MNERRPTAAAGERWRKWGARPGYQPDDHAARDGSPVEDLAIDPMHGLRPPLDPDPLTLDDAAGWGDGFDQGYERGLADALPSIVVVVLAGISGCIVGILIAVSATGVL